MEQISGVFDTLKGNSETCVYTAQGILALQEAGQARIRLKVKLMEDSLGKMAQKHFARMKQFWKQDRWVSVTRADGSYQLKEFTTNALKFDYDIRITAGSTMPVNRGAMLDLMVRLAQTQMPDGQSLVDRQAVAEYLPEEVKSALLRRMNNGNVQLQQVQQQVEQLTQQLQQFAQQNQHDDDQTMSAVEQITGAIEKLNKQILQLQDAHDKLEAEKKKEEETNKIKSDSYNQGYGDAEKMYKPSDGMNMDMMSGDSMMGKDLSEQDGTHGQLPDELLQGLESLSDDELALIVEKNPQLLDLIK
jgi:methyl-accepting chemotaxis protein